MDAYDVIIVGTGAGGGTLARHLAPSGKKILLLERRDWLPREPANWYAQAERRYEVHGNHGEDPTEGPASAQYPFPAVSHEPRIQQLADDLEAAGYHPFHAPCGIRLNEANPPHSICIRCQTCDGFPCLVHAKSDAEVLGVRPALEHPNVTLLTNAHATKLETSPDGTAVTEVV